MTQQSASLDNFYPMMDEYEALDAQIKELSERRDELGKELRSVLVDRGTVNRERYEICVEMQQGRLTFSQASKKLAESELGVDLTPYYNQGAPFTTLKIKRFA